MPQVSDYLKILNENIDDTMSWFDRGQSATPAAQSPQTFNSRSQVFDSLFGNSIDRQWPRVSERYKMVKGMKAKLDPKVYIECLENICTSMIYEPDNI